MKQTSCSGRRLSVHTTQHPSQSRFRSICALVNLAKLFLSRSCLSFEFELAIDIDIDLHAQLHDARAVDLFFARRRPIACEVQIESDRAERMIQIGKLQLVRICGWRCESEQRTATAAQ